MYKQLGFVGQDSVDVPAVSDGSGSWVASPDQTVFQNLDTGQVIQVQDAGNAVPTDPASTGGDWWSGISWSSIKDTIAPITTGVASIIKAITGQPAGNIPPGFRYDPVTGRVVPAGVYSTATATSWLLPLGLLGIGIGTVVLMRRK